MKRLIAHIQSSSSKLLAAAAITAIVAILLYSSIENDGNVQANRSITSPEPASTNDHSRIEDRVTPHPRPYQWLLDTAATNGTRQAFAQLKSRLPEDESTRVRMWLAESILRKDFSKLSEVLSAIPTLAERQAVIVAATSWAIHSDTRSALGIIQNHLSGTERNQALRCAVVELVQNRVFDIAKEVQARMPTSDERTSAIANIAYGLGATNVDGGLRWAEGLPTDERKTALRWIGDALQTEKDISGLKRMLDATTDPTIRRSTIRSIISFSVERGDSVGALTFATTLDGPERLDADQRIAALTSNTPTR